MQRRQVLLVVGALLLSSISCWLVESANPIAQYFVPTKSIDNNLDPLDREHPCRGAFDLLDDYKVECSGSKPSILNTFSGSVQYTGANYVGKTKLLVTLYSPLGEPYKKSECVIELDHIAPNETRPISCQVTEEFCAGYVLAYPVDICEFETYTDYLDSQELDEDDEDPDDADIDEVEPDPFADFTIEEVTDYLLKEWLERLKQNPCQPDLIQDDFRSWVSETLWTWANEQGIYGEGKEWAFYDDFVDAIVSQVWTNAAATAIQTWEGTFDIPVTAGVECMTCAPPYFSGTISLTANLQTCEVDGWIMGTGEGYGVKSECEDGSNNDCEVFASVDIDGDIFGSADTSGQLDLEPTIIGFDYYATFTNCENHPDGIEEDDVDDELTITGNVNWQGSASGEVSFPASSCVKSGTWIANLITIEQESD